MLGEVGGRREKERDIVGERGGRGRRRHRQRGEAWRGWPGLGRLGEGRSSLRDEGGYFAETSLDCLDFLIVTVMG